MERPITLDTNSFFFNNVYLSVNKQIKYPMNEVMVAVVNKERSEKIKKEVKDKYKFVFDYPENDESIVGIEVFYLGEVR